jgi:hypothetical protein
MTEILEVPFNRSYWVVPGKLLAGGYPGSRDPIEEERNLKGLIQAEIRHVISLLEADKSGNTACYLYIQGCGQTNAFRCSGDTSTSTRA